MNRPLSQLIYTRVQEGTGSPHIITLHKYNQYGRDVKGYALAADPNAHIIGLESYKGVFVGRSIVGYTWFIGPQTRPSPIYFGDALAEIERFLWDEIDRQEPATAELPFLIGVEQGAIMAIAAAAAVPDLISGVIAIDGTLPIVPGWSPPLAPLDGLPILLFDPLSGDPAPDGVLAGTALAQTLAEWGAVVTQRKLPRETVPGDEMATWLAKQPIRFHSITESGT